MTPPEPSHLPQALWLDPQRGIACRIDQARARLAAHPARTVVLLPHAHLLPLAHQMWGKVFGRGFAPRFETVSSWAASLAPVALPAESIRFDAARDRLTARLLLEQAGLARHSGALARRLVDAAHEVARAVAALPPPGRADWAENARPAVRAGLESGALEYEAAVARIALEWALASDYATDRLWRALDRPGAACALIVLRGLAPDPLADALCRHAGARGVSIELSAPTDAPNDRTACALHCATDAEDEAERAAACVIEHLNAGRSPVALAAVDRVLTRRVRALLAARGVSLRDESGWALSTTRAAAQVMGALRASSWNATSDSVLDWLKNSPAFSDHEVRQLELALRRGGSAQWQRWCAGCNAAPPGQSADAALLLTLRVESLRAAMQQPRPLAQWIGALRALLAASGQWEPLATDAAGERVLQTLQLSADAQAACAESFAGTVWADRRIALDDFTAWADAALEGARFAPDVATDAQVVILPLAHLWARPFAALVLPGCDEKRLPAWPEPPATWGSAQRKALGLVTREQLAEQQAAAWRHALTLPRVDLLWRASDEGAEALAPSPLLQQLLLEGGAGPKSDPRTARRISAMPTPASQPRAPQLAITRLSASGYESLRRCPYQFFALQQLGLKGDDEIEQEAGKREFGTWLHRVLKLFHDALKAPDALVQGSWTAIIDIAAEQATRDLGLADDEFLPFAAAWPKVRDGYLAWLAAHQSGGVTFEAGEVARNQRIGTLTLIGRIDRIDRAPDGSALLIDYKTEGVDATKKRIRNPDEDTQLAFYGALIDEDTLAAAYVNVGEKETTRHDQRDVVDLRDALIEGITSDMQRIAAGAPLPPLGEGTACEYCAARGLCRKDFWW